MAGRKKTTLEVDMKDRRPALTPEAREQQLANLAMNVAEQQLIDGTASSQVITHFLRIASTEQQRKMEKLEEENKLLRAKTESLQAMQRSEELFAEAISAMKLYSGEKTEEDY